MERITTSNPVRILCFLLWAACIQAAAQRNITFRNYSVEDGLVSNTIWTIAQDTQGYMWFGSRNGLSRFDGYEFKSYQFCGDSPAPLGNNFVHSTLFYDEDNLWIGTDKGVYILRLQEERFSHFKPLGNLIVKDIAKDKKGNVWIATAGRGLFKYDPDKDSFTDYSEKAGLSSKKIRKIIFDDTGNLWLATFGMGIDVLDPETSRVKNYRGREDGLHSNLMLTVYQDLKGRIWAGSFDGGLSLWQPEKGKFRTYTKDTNGLSSNIVRSILQVGPGELLVGTEKGLNILDLSKEEFRAYVHNPGDPHSLSGNAVYSIFKDRDNGIWLGTYFGGLSYYSNKPVGFEKFYPTRNGNALTGGGISSIVEEKPGEFWIGTEDEGLHYYDSKANIFRKYPFREDQEPLSYFNILSLEDVGDQLWIGTFSGGLNVYDKTTGKVSVYKHKAGDPGSPGANNIFSIYRDRSDVIWVGTSHGLSTYDKAHDNFRSVDHMGLSRKFITDIYEDNTGTIWIAVYGGELIARKRKSGEWISYPLGNKKELNGIGRFTILDDNEGHLWLGTEGNGLIKFSFREETFERYGKEHGIEANVVYDILQDDDRTLWFSTNNGIYHFDQHLEKTTHFNKWDNLQSNEFNYKAGYVASDGKMFFGGIKGFNTFYPDSLHFSSCNNNIVIHNFQVFNKDISLNQPGQKILSRTINYTDRIELSHRQSMISFEYAALNYEAPQKIRYAYKMEGFDQQWNKVGKQRKAIYTNLPPGHYTFMVKAGSDREMRSSPVAKMEVVIHPPFYRHPAAYMLYAVLIALLVLLVRKILLRRAERRNRIRLQQLGAEQEKQFYNQKIEFFTAMAHEIRTPLSLITAPLDKLMEQQSLPRNVTSELDIMHKNSNRLINLVNQLLDFRRIESDIYKIRKENIDLVAMIQAIYSRFSAMKYQKDVQFTMSTRVSRLSVMADPEALTKIFNNLLINAFKFTRSEVKLEVQEPCTDESGKRYAVVTVTDNGTGIPEEELENIFKKYFKGAANSPSSNLIGTGIGLSLSKSLIEKHGGYLEVKSIPEVRTVFKVFLPFPGNPVENTPAEDPEIHENKTGAESGDVPGTSVLVVEDDVPMLDFFSHNLSREGFRVFRAANGIQAWEIMEQQEIDLVLSDVMMPEMDGIELCEKIKTTPDYSHIPLVLLTARTNSESEISAIRHGADAYIPKPFKWNHVQAVMDNLLKTREKLREKFSNQPFIPLHSLGGNAGDKKLLKKITEIVEERIIDPRLSVKELSFELGMSRSSLHRKLKSISGKVPNEFIRLLRLKHAARLLHENEYTISEVSYMSGFNSPSYFSKCFSEQFRMTPSEFMEKHLSSHDHTGWNP